MTKKFSPTYTTKKCADLTQLDCYESSHLFSANYGRWSGKDKPEKKGQRIKLGVGLYFDEKHFNEFIEFSAEQLNDAYSRLDLSHQPWAQGTKKEINYIESLLGIEKGNSILDIGCGQGRHSIELAKRGYNVVGIDTSEKHIQKAHASAENLPVSFSVWDARKRFPGKVFDAVICLYDVIGSYRDLKDNILIVKNVARKLRKGGRAVISVMNRTHIELRAIHRGKVTENPRLLLELPSSNSMQSTGDMFNAKYQLLDESHNLVYHKEQFEQDGMLSAEYIVADYRFKQLELQQILADNGLQVIESRFVRAGHFEESLPEDHDNAKEILFVVEKQ